MTTMLTIPHHSLLFPLSLQFFLHLAAFSSKLSLDHGNLFFTVTIPFVIIALSLSSWHSLHHCSSPSCTITMFFFLPSSIIAFLCPCHCAPVVLTFPSPWPPLSLRNWQVIILVIYTPPHGPSQSMWTKLWNWHTLVCDIGYTGL